MASFNMDAENYLHDLMAMEVELRWEREMKALMEEKLLDDQAALQEKEGELSTLMENKERILAELEKKEKLIHGFMAFIGAIENKDVEKVLNFDEKGMMNDVITMLNGYSDDGANADGIPGGNNGHEIFLNPDEPVIPVTDHGTENSVAEAEHATGQGGGGRLG